MMEGKLTKNLWWSEVLRGSGYDEHVKPEGGVEANMILHANQSWQIVRRTWGDGLSIVAGGGLRSPEMNERVGGSAESRHVEGDATDIRISKHMNNRAYLDLYELIDTMQRNGRIIKGGLGLYFSHKKQAIRFIHFDSRGYLARWNGRHLKAAKGFYNA